MNDERTVDQRPGESGPTKINNGGANLLYPLCILLYKYGILLIT
jgi:hypothetical protein